jgi:serine/threonine protein kinase
MASTSKLESDSHGPRTEVVSAASTADAAEGEASLAGTLAEEMAAAWRRGEHVPPETFLNRHPDLADNRDAVLRLVCEEVCLRQELGTPVDPDDLLARFPRWRNEIQALLDCHRLLAASEEMSLELQGLDDFEVLAELGKGAQGSVYLARQKSLADRPVVLKITLRHGKEHLSLARLQHTHIVPLYWAQDDPASERRMLCMPYFGNLTLQGLMVALRHKPPALRTGQDILNALDQAQRDVPVALVGQGPARPYLGRASYGQAVCWIGACVADALQYAHDRGLVHLDIKPSNILLAGDGQPMLLDFHLAREPLRSDGPRPRGLGGTPQYMAPEQSQALQALMNDKPVPRSVDGRADVFALGLVLYQVLGGPAPPERPRLETFNPAVTPGLADIVHKCLEERPEDRYADAASLAADLRRHLMDQKLRGVRNRWSERWAKWRRRRPATLPVLVTFFGLCALLGGAAYFLYASQENARRGELLLVEQALHDGRQQLQRADFAGAIVAFERGLDLADHVSGSETVRDQLAVGLSEAKQRRLVHDLHQLTDQIRFAASAAQLKPEQKRELEQACRTLWQVRDRLLKIPVTTLQEREQIRADLRDIALWTALQSGKQTSMLREAAHLLGPSRVLSWLEQRDTHAPPAPALLTSSELQAVGWLLWQRGQAKQALPYFDRAVALEPHSFWANYYQGACALQERELPTALAAFRVCVALKPPDPHSHYNLALVYEGLNDLPAARSCAEQALLRQPDYAPARELLTRLQQR